MARRGRSPAMPLALAWAFLIVYASLYPLSDWHHPQGLWSLAFLNLPWPRWWDRFDIVANLVGYLPLGAFVFVAAARRGHGRGAALLAAILLPVLLSALLEMTQNFLPQRVPSALDLALNSAGAALGALLAAVAEAAGLTPGFGALRRRWFVDAPSTAAIALLLLWPIGLLFPAPVPFALGQIWPHLADAAAVLSGWLASVPWAARWAPEWHVADAPALPLSAPAETALTSFGLLAPCLLAFTVTRPNWRRLELVAGAGLAGLAVATFSTALNFGPRHALAWIAPTTLPAIGIALALCAIVCRVPRRAAAALALVAGTGLVVLSAQAPADPYFADSLQAWEQGRFIRFHGLAQWVGWLWPFALLAHLLRRVGARDEGLS